MKTKKALRVTGWIQLVYCLILLLDLGLTAFYANTQIPVPEGSLWYEILDIFGGIDTLLWFVPAALICLVVNLHAYLGERKGPEQRSQIGLRWLWIPAGFLAVLAVKWLYLWLVAATILYPDRFPV